MQFKNGPTLKPLISLKRGSLIMEFSIFSGFSTGAYANCFFEEGGVKPYIAERERFHKK